MKFVQNMSSVQPSQEVLVSGAGRPAEQTFQVVNKKPSQAGGISLKSYGNWVGFEMYLCFLRSQGGWL